jgi:hypothetical protein
MRFTDDCLAGFISGIVGSCGTYAREAAKQSGLGRQSGQEELDMMVGFRLSVSLFCVSETARW